MTETPRDSSDPKQIARAIKESKTRDEVAEEGLRQLMSSAQGRVWMWRHLEQCDPYRSPFTRDALQMSFNCGESNVGLRTIAELHALDPDLYLLMMKENAK